MQTRSLLLVLSVAAALGTSRGGTDYRAPCNLTAGIAPSWDVNRPLVLQWWQDGPIPINENFYDSVEVTDSQGNAIPFWAERAGPSQVNICPQVPLQPATEYRWQVLPFRNPHADHDSVPWFEFTGIQVFRTTETSELSPITSRAECRDFRHADLTILPGCTWNVIDGDFDGFDSSTDCNDADPSVNPGVEELCDGFDNNCNGAIDEGFLDNAWVDADGDGYGDPEEPVSLECVTELPPGLVSNAQDCDDTSFEVNPGATEIPGNGIDDDCMGLDAPGEDTGDAGSPSDTGDTGGTAHTGTANTGSTGDTAETGPP